MNGILLGGILLYLAFNLGRRVLVLLGAGEEEDETVVFGTALGLGLLGYAVLVLGLCGILSRTSLWWLIGCLAVLGGLDIRRAASVLKSGFSKWKMPSPRKSLVFISLAAIPVFSALLGTFAPEIANDSLCYHLHLPKVFLASGEVERIPYEVNSLFPFLMEMLYTLGLGVSGVTLAKFFHFSTGLLGAGGILIFLRRYVRIEIAWVAAFLFITTPGIINQLDTTYVDAGLTCFTILAVIAFLRWSDSRNIRWMVLSGAFFGLALSVKYFAVLSFLIVLALAVLGCLRRKPDWKRSGIALGALCGTVFLFSAYWYLRSWIELGNPVYPYFYSIFKSGNPLMTYDDIGVSKTLLNFLMIPWTVTMHPEWFEGFAVQLGPSYLAFLPAVIFGWRKIPHRWALTGFSFFYLAGWFLLGQDLRFYFPAVPVLSVLIGFGLANVWEGKTVGKTVRFLAAAVLLIHALLAVYHFRRIYPVAFGAETRDHYLEGMERSYRIAQFVNENLPHDAKILAADEAHLFYFDRPISRECSYANESGYYLKAHSADEAFRLLREDGFTHVLFVESPDVRSPGDLERFRIPRILSEPEKNAFVKSVCIQRSLKSREGKVNYYLYEIGGAGG